MGIGTCRLTLSQGKFVKSHLLPEALTQPDYKGAHLVQSGHGTRPIKRWTSWYDRSLVTRKGEDILSEYDSWGIQELRRQRLVWSGWGDAKRLTELVEHHEIADSPYGIRKFQPSDAKRLRLFFLSLLWRAAASTLVEFMEVQTTEKELEHLRTALTGASQPSPTLYPIQLLQLSTRGLRHNMTPLAQTKLIPDIKQGVSSEVPIFRFYIDGLIIHFHRKSGSQEVTDHKNSFVGEHSETLVSTVTTEKSFEYENLSEVMADTDRNWSEFADWT